MVLHTLRMACTSRLAEVVLWCTSEHAFFLDCQRRFPLTIQIQAGKDLGTRMHFALEKTLLHCRTAIIMGTDCPAINATYLQAALHELNTGKDIVLGPSEDGGYVLIGARRIDPAIFNGVSWGESRVLAQTRSALRALGWSWSELHTLWDVDRPGDLDRLYRDEEFSHLRVNDTHAE
jgi:rSAM/selenodomain-associated transferase 1